MDVNAFLASVPPLVVYLAVAAFVGVESLGIPLPGETALIAGSLIATRPDGEVSLVWVGVSGIVGAVVGDAIGYAAGRYMGRRLLDGATRRFPRSFAAPHVGYAEHLYAHYGSWAVFGGRFVALLRILSGPLAGTMRMNYPRFLLANALGGTVWAGGIALLVGVLGSAAHRWISDIGWGLAGVVVVVLAVGGRFIGRSFHARALAHADRMAMRGDVKVA